MLGSRNIGGAVGWITRGDRSMTSFFGHAHITTLMKKIMPSQNIRKVGAVLRRARVYTVVAAKPSQSTN